MKVPHTALCRTPRLALIDRECLAGIYAAPKPTEVLQGRTEFTTAAEECLMLTQTLISDNMKDLMYSVSSYLEGGIEDDFQTIQIY